MGEKSLDLNWPVNKQSWPTSFFVVYYVLTTLHVHQFIFIKKIGLEQFSLTSVLL